MKLLIVSDAWHPQTNGVVRSLSSTARELQKLDIEVDFLTPNKFRTLPLPSYPDIRLAMTTPATVARHIDSLGDTWIHIATEGPLGNFARRWCLKNSHRYSTSYHTKFPEYLAARLPVPLNWSYAWLRRFHNDGNCCMTASASLERDLSLRGFRNIRRWSRGVDHNQFRPDHRRALTCARPIFIYVGRIAVEKDVGAFVNLELPGTKVVIGDGPQLEILRAAHSDVLFTGAKYGEELAAHYASADVFVFPSRTDTFGNVLLEALSSGVPVAAFPVTGPMDVIGDAQVGVLHWDLAVAAKQALNIDREACRSHALKFTWEASAIQFLDNLKEANGATPSVDG
jgi:glycosyltransferase involved in cell wall biosynthesis